MQERGPLPQGHAFNNMTAKKLFAGIATASVLGAGGVTATDAAINPYTDMGTTLQVQTTSTLPEAGKERVVLDKTKPKMTMEKWGEEVAMGVTYNGMQAAGSRKFLSSEVDWSDGDQTMQVIPLEASSTFEDGGYEINIVLNSKPASNVFNFSIDGADQLDFFYQPPLTDKDIGEGAQQPENVTGSYAVYYKAHANHVEGQTNYATGKAYHIFRPLVTDAKGQSTWADLSYLNAVLSVTVPQSFLDNATYPVTIDPTFGNTSIGGTSSTASTFDDIEGTHAVNPGASGTLSTVSYYLSKTIGNTDTQGGVYDSSPNLVQHGNTVTVTNASAQWWDSTGLSSAITAQNYYVAFFCDCSAGNVNYFYDTVGAATRVSYNGGTYPTWTTPGVPTGSSGRKISIYATYTSASVATPHSTTKLLNSTLIINKSTLIIQ